MHTSECRFLCHMCNKRFNQSSDLHRHELTHKDERRYVCQTCSQRFNQSAGLHHHELIHKDERSFVCQTCNKRFKRTSHLYQHKRYHCRQGCEQTEMRHVRQNKCPVYVCCECDQAFYNRLKKLYNTFIYIFDLETRANHRQFVTANLFLF